MPEANRDPKWLNDVPIEDKTVEWFLARAAEMQEAYDETFMGEFQTLLKKHYPDRWTWSTPVPNFWATYPEASDEILTSMVCPVVCRGYLDGGENWHQLCLDKVKTIKEVM